MCTNSKEKRYAKSLLNIYEFKNLCKLSYLILNKSRK